MRYFIPTRAALIVLAVVALCATPAHAQKHQALAPLLIDLPGWMASERDGMSMEVAGIKIINANRSYAKGEKELTVIIMIGNQAMTQADAAESTVETSAGSMSAKTVDGFQVQTVSDKGKKSGEMVVVLAQGQKGGVVLTVSYSGLSEAEALDMVKKFDWKKMKAEAEKLL